MFIYSITEIVFIGDLPNWWRALLTRFGGNKSVWEGIGVSLDQPQWVTVYDPLARGGIRSKEKLCHG